MEKYINEDGLVGVLISSNFGAGWSTWSSDDEFMLFDKGLVKMKLKSRSADEVQEYLEAHLNRGVYVGGWDNVYIVWLEPGTQFTIDEYDGAERLVLSDSLNMTA